MPTTQIMISLYFFALEREHGGLQEMMHSLGRKQFIRNLKL